MAFTFKKPPIYRGVQDTWVLDKPIPDLLSLKDVTKQVWLDRGYGVTSWRREGASNWDLLIGSLADPDGVVNLDPRIASKQLDINPKWVSEHTNTMIRMGQIRNINGSSRFHLTLTKERQPSNSPEMITVPLQEYPSTPHCFCSTLDRDEMFLGCLTCRELVLAVIKAYYGDYWLEVESAVTRRESRNAPAVFDISKVNKQDREFLVQSIGKMLHLVGKTFPVGVPVDSNRLFWLVGHAQNRVHLNPGYFPHHQTTAPQADRQFHQATSRDAVKASGREICGNCDSPNPRSNKFCGSCGSRM